MTQYRNPRAPRYPRRSSYSPGFGGFGCIVLIIIALFLGGIAFEVYSVFHKNSVTFTVNEKVVKTDCGHDGHCKSKYLIFTDHGVFQDTDSFVYFKFNSSDLYNKLRVGQTYNCKTYGFRIPFFSKYPNLVDCEAV